MNKGKIDKCKEKIEELKSILKELGIDTAKELEENVDLQYLYLKNLQKNLKDDELFIKLVILNALVSYQLSSTGELWWKEFSNYWSEIEIKDDIFKEYKDFLVNCKGNRRLLNAKMKRIDKIEPFLKNLGIGDIKKYYKNMNVFRNHLANQLKTKKESKTIVFTVKMFGYASRISFNKFIPYPMEIEIPKDSRIEKYTRKFTNEEPIKFWKKIGREINLPPLHIDSILWPVLGKSHEVRELLKKHCKKSDLIFKLVEL
ncbi:N-glycosylase/DNA lyase [Methanotorris igneus]|uniref:N-glycosylase/DNA lyase n=1 Tax=Methanotorris igneus (strain DSM 5666 / JCM 11834 / Kol 5) TaxID=880724 RepID=F6BEL8_METIK|nr:N-glycosylase/DNA lyase [Methanotorris igneus Kol 5]